MELQIQDLVSSIKKEGIDAARTEAESIIARAKEQANAIVAQARAEAEKIEAKSQSEIEVMKESARVNAQHAQRDAVLAFKNAVQAEFEKLLSAETGKTVQGETLAKLIQAAIAEEDPAGYVAEVAEVSEGLKQALAQEIRGGLELRPGNGVKKGFRLAAKDGSGYFDCTDEEITKMLMPYFSELSI